MLFNINVIQNKILLSQIKNTKILISIITIAVSSTVYILLLSKVKCKCDYNYPFRRNSVVPIYKIYVIFWPRKDYLFIDSVKIPTPPPPKRGSGKRNGLLFVPSFFTYILVSLCINLHVCIVSVGFTYLFILFYLNYIKYLVMQSLGWGGGTPLPSPPPLTRIRTTLL